MESIDLISIAIHPADIKQNCEEGKNLTAECFSINHTAIKEWGKNKKPEMQGKCNKT